MVLLIFTACAFWSFGISNGFLYPYESESRETKSLNGLWNFRLSPRDDVDIGFREAWHSQDFTNVNDVIKMPVPSSFNDVTTNATVRDYVGWVWYQRSFYAPKRWLQGNVRVFIHFGSVHYISVVYLNNMLIGDHEGGHIPFQLELPSSLLTTLNFLTVAVNNTLTPFTVPQGEITFPNDTSRSKYPPGYRLYSHDFDYFDYAGINRPVTLFTTPLIYIKGINVTTDKKQNVWKIHYNVTSSDSTGTNCQVELVDRGSNVVARSDSNGCRGSLVVKNPQLWWPAMTCRRRPGYMYQLQVTVRQRDTDADVYRLPVGIRTISWNNTHLMINDEPVYLRGFGMHEDANIRGRGFDQVTMARDFSLIKWIGANAIRTSHYPYAEEILNEADAQGILVIVEAPACSLKGFGDKLLKRHKDYLLEMMDVHKNRPSVIMWSLANEPVSNSLEANYYFGNLSLIARKHDPTRPITLVTSQPVSVETAAQHFDIVGVNRYRAWYSDSGHLDLIPYQVTAEMAEWGLKFSKPVLITEYGAGSVAGLHTLPESMWSEDYQSVTHLQHFKAFDELRAANKLIGEMMWNFIDFNTPQEYFRPGRCSKGLFTRERQPKQAAHITRARHLALAHCPPEVPSDRSFEVEVLRC